jgi:hypothetical protein
MPVFERDKLPDGHPLKGGVHTTYRKRPFEAALDEAAKAPDPKKAFRGGILGTVLENHPGLSEEDAQEMIDAFGG